jgi:microcystin degradation protein MlrC
VLDALAQGCDALLLDLHGAMVVEGFDDGEGELLRRIRELAPRLPIGVALDMHTNLSATMGELATVLAGYQTYPHVDMYETGMRAGRPILALLEGKSRPTMAFGTRPMLPHVMRQSSLDSPNKEIQEHARALERAGSLAATFFVGFPHADIPIAGASAVVVTDGDMPRARRECDALLEHAWASRAQFVYHVEPLEHSLARAASIAARPVILLDHYDNCASGGTMDTMTVLEAVLDARLEDVAVFAIYDPQAVKTIAQAGLGANVTLALGGKHHMPALGLSATPLTVHAKVKRVVEGRYRNEGPMAKGERVNMGLCAVLDTGRAEIAVISRHTEPHDLGAFRVLGIDPGAKRYLLLKSRVHWRAGLGSIAKAIVECAGTGVCTSDYSQLRFTKVRRPIYPLDP